VKLVIGKLQNGLFTTGRSEPTTTWRGTHNRWRLRGEVQKMTIYKLSAFLFKEQGQLLLSLDLVSYGNLDKNQCASQKLKEERLCAEWGEYEKWRVHNRHKITPF
jgi:hypothetical protein